MRYFTPLCLLVVLAMMFAVAAPADEPLTDDAAPLLGWTLWGDGGDQALEVTTVDDFAPDGRRCLRVEVTLDPANPYWPSLGFEVPPEVMELEVPLVEIMVHAPEGADVLPEGTVRAEIHQGAERVGYAGSSLELVPDEWHAIRVGLRGLEDLEARPARIKLAFRPPPGAAPATFLFHVDGPFLTEDEDGYVPYDELKDLNLDTPITRDGEPIAAIVAPDDRYADALAAIQQAIQRIANVELPVITGDSDPREVLAERPVIALGNMATSQFMHELYREYYTWLDLRYPGPGGSVVRSLHNPYATGHNVILVGGSDDAGVLAAAEEFAGLLGDERDITLGWLMEIELGVGMTPPEIGETVYGWRDSHRVRPDGTAIGYDPAGTFGWHPISIQAALYYMTGEEKYLREFVRLALPDPDNIPEEILTSGAFYDMERPLVENYHYHAHTMPMLWDLIEQSPLLDHETRLRITNELRAQQDYYDPDDTYAPMAASRHGAYHMLTIFTGSRYFAKYYPAERWQTRIDNARRSFSWFVEHNTWGELDTLGWINTSIEPVLEYWHLTDPETYVAGGMARTMMSSQEILWTGRPYETSNRSQTLSLMHRATWMLEDGRYAWLLRQAGFDFDVFRIGQSWWPAPHIEIAPPTDIIGRISVMPLPQPWADRADAPFPAEEGYQFLSYRTGLGPDDGYFLLDGHDGGGRNPHHVSSINYLRLTDRLLCDGYENMVTVLRDGMSEIRVAKAARLDATVAQDGIAWVRSTVPDSAFSSWQRDLLWVDDEYAIVADIVTAREAGEFEVLCRWRPVGSGILGPEGVFGGQHPGGVNASFVCAQPALTSVDAGVLTQQRNVDLGEGESLGFINILYADEEARQFNLRMLPLGENAAVFHGRDRGLVSVGSFADEQAGIAIDADLALLTEDKVALMNGSCVATTAGEVVSEEPVSFVWRLEAGTIEFDGEAAPSLPDATAFAAALTNALDGLIERTEVPAAPTAPELPEIADWEPAWETELAGAITHVLVTGEGDARRFWVATDDPALHIFAAESSEPLRTVELPEALNAFAAIPGEAGGVAVVGGGDDDVLRLWDASGDLLWERPSHVSETFRVGERWQAPWFTDPEQKPGILSLMIADPTGSGELEIVLGRPSTVEYWSLEGELLARVPIEWGDVRALALLEHEEGPQVVVGKHITGASNASVIGPDRELVTNRRFGGIARGATSMHGWMQRGIGAVNAVDLDGDGAQEVVVAHTGHWNDVRAFDARGSQVLWQHAFGPARPRSHFIQDVLVADLDGDGAAETVVGLQNGWLVCIEADGEIRWSRRFSAGVRMLAAVRGGLVAGLDDGTAIVLSPGGEAERKIELDDAVTALDVANTIAADGEQTVLLGAANGRIVVLAR